MARLRDLWHRLTMRPSRYRSMRRAAARAKQIPRAAVALLALGLAAGALSGSGSIWVDAARAPDPLAELAGALGASGYGTQEHHVVQAFALRLDAPGAALSPSIVSDGVWWMPADEPAGLVLALDFEMGATGSSTTCATGYFCCGWCEGTNARTRCYLNTHAGNVSCPVSGGPGSPQCSVTECTQ